MSGFKNVLIVLGAGPLRDGRPSPFMISRVRKAISLYRKNKYSKIILSGGPTVTPMPEAEVMRVMMMNHIPDNKILLEPRSRDTIQNALFCWELIKDKRPKSVTVVTSAYHLRRSRHIFKRIYSHMGSSLKFESAVDPLNPIDSVYYTIKELFLLLKLKIRGIR